jgi:ABC-2 type transport system ATP-binding protein
VTSRSSTMIRTEGLTKTFRSRRRTVEAVRGLDITVERGELVAFLGPNGAGKSTTLRMLTTLLTPTSGTALVTGFDVVRQQAQVRQHIGYVGQGNGGGLDQSGVDELVMQGRVFGMDKAAARHRAAELVESLDLAGVAERKVSQLSGGQRRRLDVAMGLIHAPELLFLDEPSTGLDPQNRVNLQEHVLQLRERYDTTIVLTTHYLEEADSLAERVIVIDHGVVVADDSPDHLKAAHASDRISLTFADEALAHRAATRMKERLDGAEISQELSAVEVLLDEGPHTLPSLLTDLDLNGTPAASAEVSRPTLDDVFLNLTGRSMRDGGDPSAAKAAPAPRAGLGAAGGGR